VQGVRAWGGPLYGGLAVNGAAGVHGMLELLRQEADGATVLWLHALATATHWKGRGFGRHAVLCAMDIAHTRAVDLYLLCAQGNGFLPSFYQSLGFQEVKRTSNHYAGLGVLKMVLMRHRG